MSTTGSLVVITCSESNPQLDPARHFNLTANTTSVLKTPGGRTEGTVANIYHADQANRIGMIVVVQHTSCPWSPGTVQDNIRADIQALRASPHVRKEIPLIGYVLDTATGALAEVNVPRTGPDAEARQRVLSQMQDFGPFWS